MAVLCSNRYFYGSALSTGYVGGWQASPTGVGGSFLTVSFSGLRELVPMYMFQIGLASTVLLVLGLMVVAKLPKAKAVPAGVILWLFGALPAFWQMLR